MNWFTINWQRRIPEREVEVAFNIVNAYMEGIRTQAVGGLIAGAAWSEMIGTVMGLITTTIMAAILASTKEITEEQEGVKYNIWSD